jgi:nitrate/nitrite transport system substrate-binding protein
VISCPGRTTLKVGFIPIRCATPIIMAAPLGFYAKHGLNVEVVKTAGWAVIRDKTINKEYDASHMVAPMPIAITLGIMAHRSRPNHALDFGLCPSLSHHFVQVS